MMLAAEFFLLAIGGTACEDRGGIEREGCSMDMFRLTETSYPPTSALKQDDRANPSKVRAVILL
jgi:hypothetical protein